MSRSFRCKNCGKVFIRSSKVEKYCSDECRKKGRRLSKMMFYRRHSSDGEEIHAPKKCIICGKEFTPKRRNHLCCSYECSRRHERNLWSKRSKGKGAARGGKPHSEKKMELKKEEYRLMQEANALAPNVKQYVDGKRRLIIMRGWCAGTSKCM